MKKKILCSIAIFVIAALAAFNIQMNTMDNKLSGISLSNVEVLAYGDPGSKGWYKVETKSSRYDNGSLVSETESVDCTEGGPSSSCTKSCKTRFRQGNGWASWQNC